MPAGATARPLFLGASGPAKPADDTTPPPGSSNSVPRALECAALFDSGLPNVARIYDFLLGGKDNYAADREAALALTQAVPGAARAARDNRAFLGRAVHYLAADAGITQFIDIGTGLPVGGHVHEVARAANPAARVVYADNDPVVASYARALLADAPGLAVTDADLRYPINLLTRPEVRRVIDFDQPAAVLLVAVLHFLPDAADPWSAVWSIVERLAPGSYVVISHITSDQLAPAADTAARHVYDRAELTATTRSYDDIERFFDGLRLVPPGLADVAAWRAPVPPQAGQPVLFWAGVGRKPAPAPRLAAR